MHVAEVRRMDAKMVRGWRLVTAGIEIGLRLKFWDGNENTFLSLTQHPTHLHAHKPTQKRQK